MHATSPNKSVPITPTSPRSIPEPNVNQIAAVENINGILLRNPNYKTPRQLVTFVHSITGCFHLYHWCYYDSYSLPPYTYTKLRSSDDSSSISLQTLLIFFLQKP